MSASSQKGMTLLEIMVALSIFSIIGLASYQVLSSVMVSSQSVSQSIESLERIQKSYAQIDRDFGQYINRSIRLSGQQIEEALVISEQGQLLSLTRGGRANPLQLARSNLIRVNYDIGLNPERDNPESKNFGDKQEYLRRLSWPVLDRSDATEEPLVQLLLPVDAIELAALTNKGRYQAWPPETLREDEYLMGLSLSIRHSSLGELVRLVKVN